MIDRRFQLADTTGGLWIGMLPRWTGVGEVAEDMVGFNAAAHVIGSFNLSGIIDRGRIHWQAVNDMGLHSFAAGHWTDKFKSPSILDDVDRPIPFGTTRGIIRWDTDLKGNYLSL